MLCNFCKVNKCAAGQGFTQWTCKNCGNEQCESRNTDFDELECYECGTIGKDNWKEVL